MKINRENKGFVVVVVVVFVFVVVVFVVADQIFL